MFEKIDYENYQLQECIDNIEIGETKMNAHQSKFHNQKSNKAVYVPIAICLWSHVYNTDSFKEILHESYRIITYKETAKSVNSNVIENYLYCELLNYFIFLYSVIKPSTFTKLNLNFQFSSVAFYFSSNYEIPAADSNIKLLFDCLEISIIIKLWCSILTEKHIIIMANQGFLLYSICEALLKLVFPFKWLHTYIPVLPAHKLDFLEAPTPYIMGVLSSSTDFNSLKEEFPHHVICNVDTSQIYSECFVALPQNEETKLRKKLQFVKNPEIFDIEEIISKPSNKTLIEDVSPDRTFSENVQYIFFRVIRSALTGFKKKYMTNKVFESEHFLEDFSAHSEEHRMFWDKIVSTIAFEYFILCDQYLDDSYTKIFKNITKCENDDVLKGYYNLSLRIPKDNIKNVFDELMKPASTSQSSPSKFSYKEHMRKESFEDTFKQYTQDYSQVVDACSSNINSENNFYIKDLYKTRDRTFSYDFAITRSTFDSTNNESRLKNSLRFDGRNYCLKILNQNKDSNVLLFYSHKETDSGKESIGFINFISQINSYLEKMEIKKDITDLGIKNEIKKKILKEIEEGSEFFEESQSNSLLKPLIRKLSGKIEETLADFEVDNTSDVNTSLRNTLISQSNNNTGNNFFRTSNAGTNTGNNFFNSTNAQTWGNDRTSTTTNYCTHQKLKIDEAVELELRDCFQYYIILAFYLEDLNVQKENSKILNKILSMYEKAYYLDKKEFPKVRYFQLVNKINNLEKLTLLRSQIELKYLDDEAELKKKDSLAKILDLRIKQLKKEKTKKLVVNTIKSDDTSQSKVKQPITPKSGNFKTSESYKIDKSSILSISPKKRDYRRPSAINLLNKLSDSSQLSFKEPGTSRSNKRCGDDSIVSDYGENYSTFLKMMRDQVKDDIKKLKEKKSSDLKTSNTTSKKDSGESLITVDQKNPFNLVDKRRKSLEEDILPSCKHSLKNLIFGNCDASKIMGNMKNSESSHIKNQIINNFFKFLKTDKDPLSLGEEICLKTYSMFEKFNLNKYHSDILTPKILQEVAQSSEFANLKESVCELQKVNLTKFSSPKEKICFWLNIFNFLTLFTMILKNELLTSRYEWTRFLKNAYFNIGGYEVSLFEISNSILTNNNCSKNIYGEEAKFNSSDFRRKLILEEKGEKCKLINFGISLPTK